MVVSSGGSSSVVERWVAVSSSIWRWGIGSDDGGVKSDSGGESSGGSSVKNVSCSGGSGGSGGDSCRDSWHQLKIYSKT